MRKLLIRNGFQIEDKFNKRKEIPAGSFGNYQRKLEPDIVIEHNQKVVVLDVKYKSYDFRYGVAREDLFQLHTYIGQYGNDSDVAGCSFVYPITKLVWEKQGNSRKCPLITSHMQVMGKTIQFTVFFLVIPDSQEENYQTKLKSSTNDFIENIRSTIRDQ